MSVRKIRFTRSQLLYVGDITVKKKKSDGTYENITIDRSNATSSSVFSYCTGFWSTLRCETFEATKNPSVTDSNNGTWTIDLGSSYENIYVNCYTNAGKIELLSQNDGVLESYNISIQTSLNPNLHPVSNSNSWGANWIEYYSEVTEPIQTLDCSNHWSGHIKACVKGTNPNSCSGFTPYGDIPATAPYLTRIQKFNTEGKLYHYKLIDETPCGYITLPGSIQVSDKNQDGWIVTYNTCIGNNCLTRSDGTKYYAETIFGCRNGRLSEWGAWKCTNGTAVRTRECIQPLNGGKACPNEPLSENNSCSDGIISEWSAWVCDGTNAKSTRTCQQQPINGGAPCPSDLEKTIKCSDGKLSDWSEWKCTNGKSIRTRECIPPVNGGKPCPNNPLTENQNITCSDGKLSDWGEWTCTNGTAVRTRECIPPVNGGKPCPNEPLTENATCSDGKLSDWSEWKCTNGTAVRTRECIQPINGGKTCAKEPLTENAVCYGKFTVSYTHITIILILILLCLSSGISIFLIIDN